MGQNYHIYLHGLPVGYKLKLEIHIMLALAHGLLILGSVINIINQFLW